MIAAIRSPPQVEKILRHVGEWREAGDREGEDVIAIRGPPGTFDDNADETPGDKFDSATRSGHRRRCSRHGSSWLGS